MCGGAVCGSRRLHTRSTGFFRVPFSAVTSSDGVYLLERYRSATRSWSQRLIQRSTKRWMVVRAVYRRRHISLQHLPCASTLQGTLLQTPASVEHCASSYLGCSTSSPPHARGAAQSSSKYRGDGTKDWGDTAQHPQSSCPVVFETFLSTAVMIRDRVHRDVRCR